MLSSCTHTATVHIKGLRDLIIRFFLCLSSVLHVELCKQHCLELDVLKNWKYAGFSETRAGMLTGIFLSANLVTFIIFIKIETVAAILKLAR